MNAYYAKKVTKKRSWKVNTQVVGWKQLITFFENLIVMHEYWLWYFIYLLLTM